MQTEQEVNGDAVGHVAKVVLEVVEYDTEKVVHTLDVSGRDPRQIDMIERGMGRNLNHERFYIRRTD